MQHERPRARRGALAVACLALAAWSCDGDDATVRAVTRTRELPAPAPHAAHAGDALGGVARAAPSHAQPGEPPRAALDFALPDGWTEAAPSALRVLNLRVAGDPRAECYLTPLPGSAGGLLPNLNRWRAQMGLPPMGPAEAAALPARDFFGTRAVAVDLRGSFTGMDGATRAEPQRLLGLAHVAPEGSLFLKAVGPAAVMDAEVDAFFALAASLRPAAAHDPHDPHAGHDHPPGAHPAAPRAEPADTAADTTADTAGPLRWTTPAAWRPAPAGSMALAAFDVGPAGDARLTLSVLPGDAGGVAANLDRWAGQLGHPPLDAAAHAALPRVPLLGARAPLLELDGAFAGMGAAPRDDAGLLGTLAGDGARTVFVKLVGPADSVRAQRAAFLRFCASLEWNRGG